MCKWCGLGDHEDIDCPKEKCINMLDVEEQDKEILVTTEAQMKATIYLYPCMEKEWLQEAKSEVEQAMVKEQRTSNGIFAIGIREQHCTTGPRDNYTNKGLRPFSKYATT